MIQHSTSCPHCGCDKINPAKRTCQACGRSVDDAPKGVSRSSGGRGTGEDLVDAIEFAKSAAFKVTSIGPESGASGTGFFVREGGKNYAVTNFHVIQNSIPRGAVAIKLPKTVHPREDNFPATVVDADPINDIALLDIDFELPSEIRYLELADIQSVKQGQTVFTIGNPQGMLFNSTSGIVANTELVENSIAMSRILCNMVSAPGNSGGATVRCSDRKIIGIATAIFLPNYMQSHTICVSCETIRQRIRAYEKKRKKG